MRVWTFGAVVALVSFLVGAAAAATLEPTRPAPLVRSARPSTIGTITEFPIPFSSSQSSPQGIVTGQDGALWFAGAGWPPGGGDVVGRFYPPSAQFSIYTTPTGNSVPDWMALSTDPQNPIWFTENGAGKIASITLSGVITEHSIAKPAGAAPQGIVEGPDANMWFADFNGGNSIGRFSDGLFRHFNLQGSNVAPCLIAVGQDGALWFTEFNADRIGRITVHGRIREYVIPGHTANPYGIVAGPDGALWFTTYTSKGYIGRLDLHGRFKLYPIHTAVSVPVGITVGPDEALWFTEGGQVQMPSVASIPSPER